MKLKEVIILVVIILSIFEGYSQDYIHSLKDINKVEIISRVSVILKTHDDSSLLISSKENKRIKTNASGLKPTFGKDNTGFNVFVKQNNRTLNVESFQPRTERDIVLYLPDDINISVENLVNNDISIDGFKNEIEAKVDNGDIKIKNVNGPVIVENSNGNTFIIFKKVNQNSPISIINSHGDVDITLPRDTKADLEVSTSRGELYTDFELKLIKEDEEGRENTRSSRNIKSKLNGGGINITIFASRGNVYLRKQ